MVSIPVSRCSIVAQSCGVCVALQDPYCAWNTHEQKCVDMYDFEEDQVDSNTFLQVMNECVSGSGDQHQKKSTL